MTKELTKDDFYSILQGKLILDESGSLKSSKNIKISLYFFKKKFDEYRGNEYSDYLDLSLADYKYTFDHGFVPTKPWYQYIDEDLNKFLNESLKIFELNSATHFVVFSAEIKDCDDISYKNLIKLIKREIDFSKTKDSDFIMIIQKSTSDEKFEFLDLLGVYKKTMGDWILKLIRGDYNLKIEDFYI